MSVRSASSHAIDCGRIAVAASPVPRRAPRRLRLITHNLGDTSQASTVVYPIQSVVDALEYDLTRADSDHNTPLPMFSCNRRWIVRRRHHDLNRGMGAILHAFPGGMRNFAGHCSGQATFSLSQFDPRFSV